jgi:serine protease Do
MNGEVVGINTMIFSRSGGSEGIGFSIPSNTARKVKEQLLARGKVSRGYLGANLRPVAPTTANAAGALVGDLSPNGPASKSGLRGGDVIVEFDGKPVQTPKQLTDLIADTPVGRTVKLKFLRDGRAQTTSITLAERPGRVTTENRTSPASPGQQRMS